MTLKRQSFNDLVGVMTRLRSATGCPWDRKQTHASLLKYLREESAEVAKAVRSGDMENLEEELADVLLQVLFHAEIARQAGHFDIHDVVDTLAVKLTLRHPHVFGSDQKKKTWTDQDVLDNWPALKAYEKKVRQKRRLERRK